MRQPFFHCQNNLEPSDHNDCRNTALSKPVCSLRKDIPLKSTCEEFPLPGPNFVRLFSQDESSFSSRKVHFLLDQEIYYLLNDKPPLLLSTVMEFTFQVRRKLLTFSLSKLSTSSFISNFSEWGVSTVGSEVSVAKIALQLVCLKIQKDWNIQMWKNEWSGCHELPHLD